MSHWKSLRTQPVQRVERPRGIEVQVAAVATADEPVTIEEVQEHLRLSHDADLVLLQGLIIGVREMAEKHTRRFFVRREVTVEWNTFYTEASLPFAPHGVISSVTRIRRDGDEVLTEGEDYYTRGVEKKRLFVSQTYNISTGREDNGLRVTYQAGYDPLPHALKLQMLRDIATRYEHRESVTMQGVQRLPDTSAYDQWRDMSR